MHGRLARLFGTGWGVVLAGALALGCTGSNVGDPCIPDNVPSDGFQASESYIETQSVQCRTRVCLVYNFRGDPNDTPDTTGCTPGSGTCVTENQVADGIYCSCRCAIPDDVSSSTPTCDCPSDFECRELVDVEGAGPGARGSYCVRVPDDLSGD
jgi:hypothetical protein